MFKGINLTRIYLVYIVLRIKGEYIFVQTTILVEDIICM